jgi:hypothetical protein
MVVQQQRRRRSISGVTPQAFQRKALEYLAVGATTRDALLAQGT